MFIIDFDDTIFDTQGFHNACIQELSELGITNEHYWENYQKNRLDNQGNFIYNHDRHAKSLSELNVAEKDILDCFKRVSERAKDFLFSDTEDFLESIKALEKQMLLLTWGFPEFQRLKKVEPSGVEQHFDKVIYTSRPKEEEIAKFLENKEAREVWFINDKPEETLRLFLMFPQLKPVLKISPIFSEEVYKKTNLPYFKTLKELKEYIFSQIK